MWFLTTFCNKITIIIISILLLRVEDRIKKIQLGWFQWAEAEEDTSKRSNINKYICVIRNVPELTWDHTKTPSKQASMYFLSLHLSLTWSLNEKHLYSHQPKILNLQSLQTHFFQNLLFSPFLKTHFFLPQMEYEDEDWLCVTMDEFSLATENGFSRQMMSRKRNYDDDTREYKSKNLERFIKQDETTKFCYMRGSLNTKFCDFW